MFFKSAFYLHQKSANQALNIVLYLMFWCLCCLLYSSQIAPVEGAVSVCFFDYDAKLVPQEKIALKCTNV